MARSDETLNVHLLLRIHGIHAVAAATTAAALAAAPCAAPHRGRHAEPPPACCLRRSSRALPAQESSATVHSRADTADRSCSTSQPPWSLSSQVAHHLIPRTARRGRFEGRQVVVYCGRLRSVFSPHRWMAAPAIVQDACTRQHLHRECGAADVALTWQGGRSSPCPLPLPSVLWVLIYNPTQLSYISGDRGRRGERRQCCSSTRLGTNITQQGGWHMPGHNCGPAWPWHR